MVSYLTRLLTSFVYIMTNTYLFRGKRCFIQGRPLNSNVEARCFIEKVGGNEFYMLIFSKVGGGYFYILKVRFLLFHDLFKFQFDLHLETSLIL